MFRHNFLIAFRNLKRHTGSSLLNLVGLSTGLASTLLIYLWVNDELSIDKFHTNDGRLYQVLKNAPEGDGSIGTFQTTPALMAQTMTEDLPEIEYSASVLKRDNGIMAVGEKHIKAKHMFASKDFFKVFSYKLLQGRKENLLNEKYEILISDELARKLFGTTENAIGKTVEWEWRDKFNGAYTVAGLFEAPSSQSSEKFDILFAHALWIDKSKDTYWGSNNAQTYIVLRNGVNAAAFGDKIREYSRQKFEKLHGKEGLKWEGTVLLQRYSDRYLYDHFENGVQSGGKIEYVKLLAAVALFILVIACINFMNLSTAKASRRVKEVGVKKVVGAQRGSIALQHLGESVLMAFLSLVVALVLIYLLLPAFNQITGKHLWLSFTTNIIITVVGLTFLTGLIAGSYPAIYLSGFRPAVVLKGLIKTSIGESWVRNGLVVFQFCISVMLIVSVVVIYQQISFIHTKNLGFEKENIIRINNEGNLRKGQATFHNEVKKIAGVVEVSGISGDLVGNHSGGGGINWEGKNPNEGIEFDGFYVDYNLVEMLNLKLKEGRSFSPTVGSDRDKVIFNETAIAMMKLKDPVGKTVTMWGKERQIIGIVKNFHYESLYESVGPFFIACEENNFSTMIKIQAGMEQETLERLSKLYSAFNLGLPFEYQFLDQDFEELYAAENRVSILSRYFAGIAILISCLGLFGLVAFTAERRTKEIGIRKVLGSDEWDIILLLSKNFTGMVMMAVIIGLPLSYLITHWWLQRFAYRIDLEWWFFAGAGFMALFTAWLTVGLQTIKAATANPVDSLRSE